MSVFLPMSITVLTWSLYPLAATIGLATMSGLEMVFLIHIFAGLSSIVVGFAYLKYKGLIRESITVQKSLDKSAYITIFLSGVTGALAHGAFIFALTLAHKGGVSLLFESWPIIAVIATPLLMRKKWKQVSLKEFLISIIALFGIAIVIFSDEKLNFDFGASLFAETDLVVLGGYILAFAGAYLSAVVAVTKGSYAYQLQDLKNNIAACIISESLSRIISMVILLLLFIILKEEFSFTGANLLTAFYIGFGVLFTGSVFYSLSLLNAETPTVHILYYLVPVFAVIWLWMAGEATINSGLFIGGAIIIAANIYLVIAGRKAPVSEPDEGL